MAGSLDEKWGLGKEGRQSGRDGEEKRVTASRGASVSTRTHVIP